MSWDFKIKGGLYESISIVSLRVVFATVRLDVSSELILHIHMQPDGRW